MDRELIIEMSEVLAAPSGSLMAAAKSKRLQSIDEAASWPSGPDKKNKVETVLYQQGEYTVVLGKPGKEAAPDYTPSNPWDMTPIVKRNGGDLNYLPTFGELFSAIQHSATQSRMGTCFFEVLGHVFVRNAYMLDHAMNREGQWRYCIPEVVYRRLESETGAVDGVPLDVFLHLIEAIALNEDVKYTKRSGRLSTAGRVNTMLTFAHLCAVFAGRANLGDFAGAFARVPVGVAPLTQKDTRAIFPLLAPDATRLESVPVELGSAQAYLRRFVGVAAHELAALCSGNRPISPNNKGRLRLTVDRLLQEKMSKSAYASLQSKVMLKVIRVDNDYMPREDVSFPRFENEALLATPWPKSSLRCDIAKPFLYVLFSSEPTGEEVLLGTRMGLIPLDEIEVDARQAWLRTTEALRSANRDALPSASESIFFVRNHDAKKRTNEAGETVTPLSFWLSRHYVKELLLRWLPESAD